MFEGFAEDQIEAAEASVYVRHGGEGPPGSPAAALGDFFSGAA